jgi:2-alkyl-3-oxoalkanoate reductase
MTGLKGKTVLVTGATGFLGGALALRLAAEGAHVKALARRPNRDKYLAGVANIEIITGDILDAPRMGEVMAGCEVVFHVAAALEGTLAHQQTVNVEGTRHVALAAEQNGVKRLVHVSSIAIYGFPFPEGIPVTEDHPPRPSRTPYNHTKLLAEQMLISTAKNVPYSIIRPALIYGPRSNMWTRVMFSLARLRPTPFVGNGSGSAHPIFVDDVVDLMLILATHPNAAGEAFNCAPDPAVTWRDLIGAYSGLAGHQRWLALPVPLMQVVAYLIEGFLTLRGQPQQVPDMVTFITRHNTFSMQKARELLGWQPQVSLSEGIARCAPYLQEKGLLSS